jgi:hypothetical protein
VIARRQREPFETPRWFVAFMAMMLVLGIGLLGVIVWALIEVVRWLTSS